MTTGTIEKLQQYEAKQAASEQLHQSQAVAKYRELVVKLANDEQVSEPKAAAILEPVVKTVDDLTRDVRWLKQGKELASVASTEPNLAMQTEAARQAHVNFNVYGRREAERELDKKASELYRQFKTLEPELKSVQEAREQLLSGASPAIQSRLDSLRADHKRRMQQVGDYRKQADAARQKMNSFARDTHRNENLTEDGRRAKAEEARRLHQTLNQQADETELGAADVKLQIDAVLAEMVAPEGMFDIG